MLTLYNLIEGPDGGTLWALITGTASNLELGIVSRISGSFDRAVDIYGLYRRIFRSGGPRRRLYFYVIHWANSVAVIPVTNQHIDRLRKLGYTFLVGVSPDTPSGVPLRSGPSAPWLVASDWNSGTPLWH